MCGRYSLDNGSPNRKLLAIINMMEKNYPGEYKTGEIFPGDTAPAIIEQNGKIVAVPAVFGFPGFHEGKLLINARSETASEKPAFSESMKNQRMILPATGFFEWSHDMSRTKYQFTVEASRVFYLCGIYKLVDGQYRFVILTRAANESMIETHDRMPVIATEQEVRSYLSDYASAMKIISSAAPRLTREQAE